MFIQPVIICGGQGTRLWPLSRKNKPKQFLKIFDNKCLFELTIERLNGLQNALDPIIVTHNDYEFFVKNILSSLNVNAQIILEPRGRNTTAAIYIAAKHMDKNDLMLIMPSDHIIKNKNKFVKAINNIPLNLIKDDWITLGVTPNHPSEAYGYLEINKTKNDLLYNVISFHEKPSLSKATKMISSKNFLWNCGIFLGLRNNVISSTNLYARYVSKQCDKVFETKIVKDNNVITFDASEFEKIPSISIDYSVMEKENKIKCMKIENDWCDVGSWDRALEFVNMSKNSKNKIEINGGNNIFPCENRMIATVGVSDLIIIDSKDATFISKKNNPENMRQLIKKIESKKSNFLEDSLYDDRPWGNFEVLLDDVGLKVKKLTIYPKHRISLQYHKKRSEHWVVIDGKASVYLDGKYLELNVGESVDIKKNAKHFVENLTDHDLKIIEVQRGEYLGEDDIIRINDPYNR